MKLQDAIRKRKSIRRYSHKKPDWRKILRAIDAARFAPTAGNHFVMKFIVVDDKEKIIQLAQASHQKFIEKAEYVVVAVSDEEKLTKLYDDRGKIYSRQQAGAAIQNFLLSLQEQKLVTTWIGFFDENLIKTTLTIPENKKVEALFPIGIETKIKTKEQKKRTLESYLRFNNWGQKTLTKDPRHRIEV